ncbi:glycoside hydrolase family 95 protein [uncultured Microbulbifer sp.]|uniref:glycoside hydrolase family 95 protein n=1 Tax=uncultured Microbulbifer sp. TaxID=348147 RepID=UPI0025CD144A|nr:glycoside hydrolase family 95 protein [uncultured Microbulbifer sp.]
MNREVSRRQPVGTTCNRIATALALWLASGMTAASENPVPLEIWFDQPARSWETESLPIGNGALGATVQGGVTRDTLQFNEKTLWTGGPGSKENTTGQYDFGLPRESRTAALAQVRGELAKKGALPPQDVADVLGHKITGYGNYQSFGNLVLEFPDAGAVHDYRRSLDLRSGVASVTYSSGDVHYTREYLASYPDEIIAVHLSSNRPGSIHFSARLAIPDNRTAHTHAGNQRITVSGRLDDNGLGYEAQLQLVTEGGRVQTERDGTLTVSGADSATLLLAAGTEYAAEYPQYRGNNPHRMVQARMDRVSRKLRSGGYPVLRNSHIADYAELFSRVRLDLHTPAVAAPPINQWLESYGTGNRTADRALEQLYFQYGRYLLISSSRAGSLPANLQGVWNNSATPPWNADYHANINLQMNYWPAEVTNLAETTAPLFDFIDNLQAPGALAAEKLLGARGWTLFLNTNVWGFSGVIDWPTAFWQPEAGAWLADHYYEHYRFNRDQRFLRERAYPVMKAAAQLWLDSLIEDPRDGKLVVSPSYSPEHGNFTIGAAMSQQLVHELLSSTRDAASLLGDTAFASELNIALENLDPGLRIGKWGQLQEWKQDLDDPENQHRHVSHLYALFPGEKISANTPELLEAARNSLNARGDAGTGWSRAWKIALWANLNNGDRAHKILAAQLKDSTLPNLWSSHPPFQIDGNFGATAGMAEMLLQSKNGRIQLLPALPQSWPDGRVTGLRARGNVTVDMHWQERQLQQARLYTGSDGEIQLQLPENADFVLREAGSKKILAMDGRGTSKAFTARAGKSYLLTRFEPQSSPVSGE